MKRGDNYTFLTTAPVGRVILTMAVPTIISMLTTSVYNIVDTFFVGQINTQATAAVGVVFPIMSIIQAVGFFFGQGSGTYISRKLGSKETGLASLMASTSFFLSFLFGLVLAVVGWIFLEPLSVALGSTPTILPYTKKFLGVILIGTPFMTSALTLNNQIRFQGNASYSMYGIISGAVLNVITVPLFAFGFKLGITGAAIGTVIGQIASFAVLYAMTYFGGTIRLHFNQIRLDKEVLWNIVKGGTPSLTRQGLASVATIMLNLAAAKYGDAAIAGMSIVARVSFVVFSVTIGIGQGFQPLCGFCFGAGLHDRVKKGYWFCCKAGLAFLLPVCVLGFIFAEGIIDILRHDPEVVAVGAVALRWQILTYPIAALITVSNMTLQTSGCSAAANLLASCRNGLFFVPLILLLPAIWGLTGVEVCQTVADLFSLCVAIPLMLRYFRSHR